MWHRGLQQASFRADARKLERKFKMAQALALANEQPTQLNLTWTGNELRGTISGNASSHRATFRLKKRLYFLDRTPLTRLELHFNSRGELAEHGILTLQENDESYELQF